MPQTKLLFYQDERRRAPVVEWLRELRRKDIAAYTLCAAAIRRLAAVGHELRRPTADYLRDGIYELRARRGHVNYRILYFYHGRNIAILGHALTKEATVPSGDIERTIERRRMYESDPQRYTYKETIDFG